MFTFTLLSLLLLWLLVPFTLLFLCAPCCFALFSSNYPSTALLTCSLLLLFLFVLPAALPCFLYSSLSHYPCCCSIFLFPFTILSLCASCCPALCTFTLLSLIIPAAALSSCSLLLFFISLSLLLLYLLVPLYYSFSYYPCCSALFPTNLLSLCVPCWFASVPFTHLYHIIPIATLSSCFLYSTLSVYSCCCSIFLFALTTLSLCIPAAALFSCSLYSSLSYYPCCCSIFLFAFTLLYLLTPAAALSSGSSLLFFLFVFPAALPCSPLFFFLLLSLLLLCLLVPFTILSLCVPCCSALFPTNLLSLCVPCCFALVPFTHLSHIIPIATLSSCFL